VGDGVDGMDRAILPANTSGYLFHKPFSGRFIALQVRHRQTGRNLLKVNHLHRACVAGCTRSAAYFAAKNQVLATLGWNSAK
jgi:hypothetical protein